jgi:hypothetical protein
MSVRSLNILPTISVFFMKGRKITELLAGVSAVPRKVNALLSAEKPFEDGVSLLYISRYARQHGCRRIYA